MWLVKRYYNGSVGVKEFATKQEAEEWLNSDAVQEDMEYGMSFKLEEKED